MIACEFPNGYTVSYAGEFRAPDGQALIYYDLPMRIHAGGQVIETYLRIEYNPATGEAGEVATETERHRRLIQNALGGGDLCLV